MPTDAEAKDLLIGLLREAAGLEHSLLNAYLYAGCALKSTPAEFAVADRPNIRRAQQFERTRAWKQTLFGVAQEEMRHLHFVQCLLRALGERPSFVLPRRNDDGVWHVGGWRAKTGAAEGRGVDIPVEPLSDSTVRRFVLYEASDSLQVADPFGTEMRARYRQLADLEFNLRLEAILLNANDQQRASLGPELRRVYSEVAAVTPLHVAALAEAVALPTIEDIRFQSIADLYYSGILPLYEQAFELGWVTENNRDLINEILDPRYAAEGFLPIGPIKRPGNFETIASRNDSNPLRHYLNVYDIIQEIVQEGEGFSAFEQQSAELLTVVERVGARGYLNALLLAKRPNTKLPDWLVRGELLRNSHLYRFAVMLSDIEREHELGGADFKPARTPIDVAHNAGLADLTQQLPAQFNACYLVLVAWLSRIYELTHWTADMRRREAIEMLATWPLMSLAIRPFLEIASLLPVNIKQLFRLEASAMPQLPVVSVQLLAEYLEPVRSETGNARMDYLALRTLTGVASWAGRQQEVVASATISPHTKQLLTSRLRALAKLSEFEKQFPFRVAGGYSSRPPNELERRPPNAEETRFAEDPAALNPLFAESLVLRLRFAGRGLVQLATDPDPPSDEAGCSGTHMLHAADGDMRALDRSLIWQPGLTTKSITREPTGALPPVSVNCVDAALMGTDANGAKAGYVPIGMMQSSGAVQTSGIQRNLAVSGLNELLSLDSAKLAPHASTIRITLQPTDGQWPYLVGENHLTWQDGEPIDPFIVAVLADPRPEAAEAAPQLLFGREVFNEQQSLLEMSPVQRILSCRAPVGFDSAQNIPSWVLSSLSAQERQLLADVRFPMSYLKQRGSVLTDALSAVVGNAAPDSEDRIDTIVSYAERLRLVNQPRGTTVAWLTILLHYGHTLSGDQLPTAEANPLLAALGEQCGLQFGLEDRRPRGQVNGRWLVAYTKGVMDTDALSDQVFGELYIPLVVKGTTGPIRFSRRWSFASLMEPAVTAFGCQFTTPFWAPYELSADGQSRTIATPVGTVTETLTEQRPTGYSYTAAGINAVTAFAGTLDVVRYEADANRGEFTWSLTFVSTDSQAIVSALNYLGQMASAMSEALSTQFALKPELPS